MPKAVFFGCPPEHGHGNVPRYHKVDQDLDDSMVCDIYVGVEDEGVLVGRGRSFGMCALACLIRSFSFQWHPQLLTTMFRYFLRMTLDDSSKYRTEMPESFMGAQQGLGMRTSLSTGFFFVQNQVAATHADSRKNEFWHFVK